MDQSPDRAGWYLALGVAAILAGVGLFVYTLVGGILHVTDGLRQVVVPGEADLHLQANVKYTVFLERESVVNGRIFSDRENLNGLSCHLWPGSGAEVALQRPRVNLTYNVNGRSGRSLLEFTPQSRGVHHLVCGFDEGNQTSQAVLAVGRGVGNKLVSLMARCLATLFGGGIVGAALLIYAYRLRRDVRLQASRASQPSPQPFL